MEGKRDLTSATCLLVNMAEKIIREARASVDSQIEKKRTALRNAKCDVHGSSLDGVIYMPLLDAIDSALTDVIDDKYDAILETEIWKRAMRLIRLTRNNPKNGD